MSTDGRIPATGLHQRSTPANLNSMLLLRTSLLPAILLAAHAAIAQMPPMPGMDEPAPAAAPQHAGMSMAEPMRSGSLIEEVEHHAGSGTTAQPNSTPAPMLMSMHGEWMLM